MKHVSITTANIRVIQTEKVWKSTIGLYCCKVCTIEPPREMLIENVQFWNTHKTFIRSTNIFRCRYCAAFSYSFDTMFTIRMYKI